MLEMRRLLAESVMLIEIKEIAGPDYYPTDHAFQKWAHEKILRDLHAEASPVFYWSS